MSQIRAKNTKPEMLVRKFLHAEDFPYRTKQELSICSIVQLAVFSTFIVTHKL
jgi:G:T-mismatch repair DNA endonuclease (very short patch repair protein)